MHMCFHSLLVYIYNDNTVITLWMLEYYSRHRTFLVTIARHCNLKITPAYKWQYCTWYETNRRGFNETNKWDKTIAVRDCLVRPYARISECLVRYLCLDYEYKIGHIDRIPVKCELNISCNLHTNAQVWISKCIWTRRKSTGTKGLTI